MYIIRRHRERVMLYSHTKIPYWVTVRGQDGVAGEGMLVGEPIFRY